MDAMHFCVKDLVDKKKVISKHCPTEKCWLFFYQDIARKNVPPGGDVHSRTKAFVVFDGHATVTIKGTC